jgi:hypothetical protein
MTDQTENPGGRLFEFLRALRDHERWSVEAQIIRQDELVIGRRFDTRALAVRHDCGSGSLCGGWSSSWVWRVPESSPADKTRFQPVRVARSRPAGRSTDAFSGVAVGPAVRDAAVNQAVGVIPEYPFRRCC